MFDYWEANPKHLCRQLSVGLGFLFCPENGHVACCVILDVRLVCHTAENDSMMVFLLQ